MKEYLITYASLDGRKHRTLKKGASSIEAIVSLFSNCPFQHRLELVSCEEVTNDTDLSGIVTWEARGRHIVEVRY